MSDSNQTTSLGKAIGLALAAASIVAVVLLAISWPAVTSDPHDIPVGVVGTAEQVEQAKGQVSAQSEGAIALQAYPDRDRAVSAIKQREVYGAIVFETGRAPEILIATAANASIAQMLQGMANGMQVSMSEQINLAVTKQVQQLIDSLKALTSGKAPSALAATQNEFKMPSAQVKVSDLAPFSQEDPRGAALSAAALPLVMGGLIGAVIVSIAISGLRPKMIALSVYAIAAGLLLTLILGNWFGALPGGFWMNVLAIGMAIAAIAAPIIGLFSVMGRAGLGIGVLVMFFFANPISGAAIPKEFIVGSWGEIGQWFPPGSAMTLMRQLSYFPDASNTFAWLVLSSWLVFGLGLILLGALTGAKRNQSQVGA